MKIYVVTYNSGSIDEGTDTRIVGVFLNKRDARQECINLEARDPFFNRAYDYAEVEEFEVQ